MGSPLELPNTTLCLNQVVMTFETGVDRDQFLADFFPKRHMPDDGTGFYITEHPIYRYIAVYMLQVTLMKEERRNEPALREDSR